MSVSLEEQRRLLLEQIEASREVYRRMLAGEAVPARTHAAGTVRLVPTADAIIAGGPRAHHTAPGAAGRNKAMQWAMDHPLWVAGGVSMLVLLLPRLIEASRRGNERRAQRRPGRRRDDLGQDLRPGRSAGAARALVTAALLLLRDPARLKAAGRLAAVAWRWLQSRRAR